MLIPIEHLTPDGLSAEFAAAVAAHGWSSERIALFNAGFSLYWRRSADLARRVRGWPAPRLRHVAVIAEPLAVHPYVSLLNTSAWTLYADDCDPASHAEFLAYLLAYGDRLMVLGEVTMAALHHAAWWFERSHSECAAFTAAAARSSRPDADAFGALATMLPWLGQLGHPAVNPVAGDHLLIPGTEVQVPRELEAFPLALVESWTIAARHAVTTYVNRWRATPTAIPSLLAWLTGAAPPLLITARQRIIWDPAAPDRVGAVRGELKRCSAAAVDDIDADLHLVARHTERFLAALAAPGSLPPGSEAEQRGYVYMHRERGLLVYDLDEPGIDRRTGPALPFARAMLGARAVHEWAHRAVDAGCVPWSLPAAEERTRLDAIATLLDAAIAAAPAAVRDTTADDLRSLVAEEGGTPGSALATLLTRRMPDFQCNLLAQRFLDEAERETYVRHNVRTLRGELPPARRWRLLVRYLYELQYLRFSAVADPHRFLLHSTWADEDLIASGLVDRATFDALADAVSALCDGYAVDETKIHVG